MRVVIVSSELPPGPGGIGQHAHQLADRLCGAGHQVVVVSPQDYARAEEVEQFNDTVPYQVVSPGRSGGRLWSGLRRFLAIARRLRPSEVDVVLATGQRSLWVVAFVASVRRLRWVAVVHGSELSATSTPLRTVTRWSLRRAVAVVAVSGFTAELARALCAELSPIVIPNGADEGRFHVASPATRTELRNALAIDRPALLTVGHVSERKGQDVVVRALAEVARSDPRPLYLVAGLPTRGPELEHLAASLGIADDVRILGQVDGERLRELYQACDVFVMTSRTTPDGDVEGFGIAVIEAALCGRPAVVTEGSGLSEAVEHEVTGLCVAPTPAAVAEAVRRLLDDGELRTQLGRAAECRARERYTWAVVAGTYHEVLRAVAAGGDGR